MDNFKLEMRNPFEFGFCASWQKDGNDYHTWIDNRGDYEGKLYRRVTGAPSSSIKTLDLSAKVHTATRSALAERVTPETIAAAREAFQRPFMLPLDCLTALTPDARAAFDLFIEAATPDDIKLAARLLAS